MRDILRSILRDPEFPIKINISSNKKEGCMPAAGFLSVGGAICNRLHFHKDNVSYPVSGKLSLEKSIFSVEIPQPIARKIRFAWGNINEWHIQLFGDYDSSRVYWRRGFYQVWQHVMVQRCMNLDGTFMTKYTRKFAKIGRILVNKHMDLINGAPLTGSDHRDLFKAIDKAILAII